MPTHAAEDYAAAKTRIQPATRRCVATDFNQTTNARVPSETLREPRLPSENVIFADMCLKTPDDLGRKSQFQNIFFHRECDFSISQSKICALRGTIGGILSGFHSDRKTPKNDS